MSDLGVPINNAEALTQTDSDTGAATPSEWFLASCSVSGNVSVDLAGGATIVLYCHAGCSFFRASVVRVNNTGTTATGNYYNLKVR